MPPKWAITFVPPARISTLESSEFPEDCAKNLVETRVVGSLAHRNLTCFGACAAIFGPTTLRLISQTRFLRSVLLVQPSAFRVKSESRGIVVLWELLPANRNRISLAARKPRAYACTAS